MTEDLARDLILAKFPETIYLMHLIWFTKVKGKTKPILVINFHASFPKDLRKKVKDFFESLAQ